MTKTKQFDKASFIKTFNSIARHKHRYQVFSDFVTMSAIALHNGVCKFKTLESEYMEIVGKYSKDEACKITELFANLVILLNPEPRDILGGLYMELDLGNNNNGQFFTSPEISLMLAEITYGDELEKLEKPFITLSEPACGAGGMVLAFTKIMRDHNHNPAEKLWVQCTDIDRTAGLMCYLQLSLWNIPAEVIIGNTLSMEVREIYYTPAHYLGNWDAKLRLQEQHKAIKSILEIEDIEPGETVKTETKIEVVPEVQEQPKQPDKKENGKNGQLDLFDF
jgi:type I restriction-modification system DNA methylase subunit